MATRNYKKCVVCNRRRIPESNTFLARLPLEPERCRMWVKAIGQEDLAYLPIEKLHQLKFVCGLHFSSEDFNTAKTRLSPHAVPKLQLPLQPLSDQLLVNFPLHVHSKSKASARCETVELSSPTAASEVEDVPEDNSGEGVNEDPGEFSWQKKTDVISCEPEADDFSQDASLYSDNVQIINSDTECDSEGYICNECNNPVKGGRFICTQCVDYDLCAQCAGERAAHRQHYLLRVPPRRPPEEVQKVLQAIRSALDNDGVTIRSGNENENQETNEIKSEIKDETYDDPLGDLLIKELQDTQQQTNKETLKRTVQHTIVIEDTRKRKKVETPDDSNTPLGSVFRSQLFEDLDAVSVTAVSNAECTDELPTTLISSPSMSKSLMKPIVMTNTVRQARTPILATQPAHNEPVQPKLLSVTPRQYAAPVRKRMVLKLSTSTSSKIKPQQRVKLVTTVPGTTTSRPEQTLQLVPIKVVKSSLIQKQDLLTESRRICLSRNESTSKSSQDFQHLDNTPPDTSKS